MISIAALTALTLIQVSSGDPMLEQPDTFVSPAATSALANEGSENVYCFDVPEGSASHEVVCLASHEWQAVFEEAEEQAAHEESVRIRSHQIGRSMPQNAGLLTP